MRTRNTSIVFRRLAVVLLAALLLASAPGGVQAREVAGDGDANEPLVFMTELRAVNDVVHAAGKMSPDLVVGSFLGPTATLPLTPGASETFSFTARPIWTASGEHADSLYQYGPENWTISSISNAPANNRGNGIAVDQDFSNPQTGYNTTDYAHAYWGYNDGSGAYWYVDWPAIENALPNRTWEDYYSWGVYTAAASPGGAQIEVSTTFAVPSSWTAYLCPGANAGTADEYVGMSGNSADPNYMETWLRSSDCSSTACPVDVYQIPTLACRKPAVSVTKTGRVTDITDPLPQGGDGTVTVQYCFIVTNATTPGAGVHLASYRVTDSAIGYDSGNVTQALAPGASAPQICAPNYTYNVTWPAGGGVCVTNTSGASATGTTPSGWGETTAGDPGSGFSSRTFTSAAATGGAGLQTCASPLAVDLAAFTATTVPAGVTLAWETVSETDNAGFNVYRSQGSDDFSRPSDPWLKLNDALIPAATPGSSEGHAYTWTDAAAQLHTGYVYRLEAVALDGTAEILGTLDVAYRPARRTWLPLGW